MEEEKKNMIIVYRVSCESSHSINKAYHFLNKDRAVDKYQELLVDLKNMTFDRNWIDIKINYQEIMHGDYDQFHKEEIDLDNTDSDEEENR